MRASGPPVNHVTWLFVPEFVQEGHKENYAGTSISKRATSGYGHAQEVPRWSPCLRTHRPIAARTLGLCFSIRRLLFLALRLGPCRPQPSSWQFPLQTPHRALRGPPSQGSFIAAFFVGNCHPSDIAARASVMRGGNRRECQAREGGSKAGLAPTCLPRRERRELTPDKSSRSRPSPLTASRPKVWNPSYLDLAGEWRELAQETASDADHVTMCCTTPN